MLELWFFIGSIRYQKVVSSNVWVRETFLDIVEAALLNTEQWVKWLFVKWKMPHRKDHLTSVLYFFTLIKQLCSAKEALTDPEHGTCPTANSKQTQSTASWWTSSRLLQLKARHFPEELVKTKPKESKYWTFARWTQTQLQIKANAALYQLLSNIVHTGIICLFHFYSLFAQSPKKQISMHV